MHCNKDKTQGISGKSNLWLQLTSEETNEILPTVRLFGADRTLLLVNEELLNTL
jgi:hypothetical protein